MPSKKIADIMAQYTAAPKNHMQVLEDGELSIIFDYLTQHNQVKNIESIFADTYHEPKPAPEAKPATQMQTYVVQPNEDLVGISLKWGVMLPALREANNLADDVNEVAPGTTLKIPMAAQ